MTKKSLHCLLTDTASARYMRPVIDTWQSRDTSFALNLHISREAAPVLEDLSEKNPTRMLDRTDGTSIVDTSCDEGLLILSSAGGWPVEHATKRHAQTLDIPVIQLIDTWYGYRVRLTENEDWLLPNILMLVDEIAASEAQSEGVPAEIVKIVGNPAWEQIEPEPASTTQKILFLGAPVKHGYGDRLGYDENSAWDLVLQAASEQPELFSELYYAPHPEQDEPDRLGPAKLTRYQPDRLDLYDTYIGMFSAPLIEAYLAGRRAISVQPNATGLDMCPLSRHGRVRRVSSANELSLALGGSSMSSTQLRQSLRGSTQRVMETIDTALAA
ncbi:MAG TPA: hypothetical protein DCS82_08480 [Rhodospirillaceae bacterium]|nr:hypothetical protein [Rhodospirillaceae bacterium]HAA91894.1 hypothetical protein [Rhodospirillaceae bacterium]HAT35738.1 hypothetical protein [Rhodospirillaceae bacterium]